MSSYRPHRSYHLTDANQHATDSSEGMDTQLDLWSADVPDEDAVDTRSGTWSPVFFDWDQARANYTPGMIIDFSLPTVPSVSKLSSSFSKKCTISPPQVIPDRFGSLPWFALEEILFNLPDLTTLHQLCQASPAVYQYLGDKTGIFPIVVERIMDSWIEPYETEPSYSNPRILLYKIMRQPDRGYHEDTCSLFRTLVYLWWKEDAVARGVTADGNPLPDDFNSDSLYYVNVGARGWTKPSNIGEVPLPASTPPKILRHLISLASRIRADAHVFFHAAMKHLKTRKIKELRYKKVPWKQIGTGHPPATPVDSSGEHWPLTWLEEQRLMLALLKPCVFSVLRRVVCEKTILTTNAPTPNPIREYYSTTLEDLEKDALVDYWIPFYHTHERGNVPLEQLETIITWKDSEKRVHGAIRKKNAKFTTCCPEFSELTEKQFRTGLWSLQHNTLSAVFVAQNSTHPVVRDAGLRGNFHKFGVSFWDNDRMMYLGLAIEKMHREVDLKDLACRWLTLLLSTHSCKGSGQERPNKFRCRTSAIPVDR
ncbi:hypothetical protein N7536_007005 [Penicillium majusculum]|uniref:Uncharacterized protein n=1 Tax=Penicillium solitum TaxID=60172 RepID=A0A1V6RKZ1_9EURO|nr:uncharacterized protein PENSOL_c002G05430 [Penicillium solitum]KAJ5696593.1 hypothetical protein N7536_007005 [Penicillium majusculum]OQE02501.1 hypothetical protein PENSOL_c002G05430 [Penicillium solitum]